jgi:hypothetical protein
MSNFNNDISMANIAISNKLIPIIKTFKNFKNSEFICLENKKNDIGDMFDMHCGFDWFIKNNYGLRGLAVRCQQVTDKKYRSFTIRKTRKSGANTEITKRINAIQKGYLYPYYTIQAYLKGDWSSDIDYFGMIKTEDLYNNLFDIKTYQLSNEEVKFLVAPWDEFKKRGIEVAIYESKKQ